MLSICVNIYIFAKCRGEPAGRRGRAKRLRAAAAPWHDPAPVCPDAGRRALIPALLAAKGGEAGEEDAGDSDSSGASSGLGDACELAPGAADAAAALALLCEADEAGGLLSLAPPAAVSGLLDA